MFVLLSKKILLDVFLAYFTDRTSTLISELVGVNDIDGKV